MTSLVPGNLTVAGHKTAVRLEPEFWSALDEICARQGITRHEFATRVAKKKRTGGFTAALRVAVLKYFREAA